MGNVRPYALLASLLVLSAFPALAQTTHPDQYEQPPIADGSYPRGCQVLGIDGAAFVKMACDSEAAMRAYDAYCCVSGGKFYFTTRAKWLVLKEKAEKETFALPDPASISDGEQAWLLGLKAIKYKSDYKSAIALQERGAYLDNFSSMTELANIYNYHYKDIGISQSLAKNKVFFWVDEARKWSIRHQNKGAIDYMRNTWPLPGEVTDADRFNQLGVLAIQDIQARKAYEKCVQGLFAKYQDSRKVQENLGACS